MNDIHATNPYIGFDPAPYPSDLRGWDSQAPVFAEVIECVRPALIIEVGTWLGASAIHMADVSKMLGLATKIICVDTFLGSVEMWLFPNDSEHQADALRLQHGYPTLYYTFLANVVRAGHQDRIVPFPTTTLIAADYFATKGIQADLIYIDASHDERSARADIEAYWPLVRPGGILFGDDLPWPGVAAAVNDFAAQHGLEIGGNWRHWQLQKVGPKDHP